MDLFGYNVNVIDFSTITGQTLDFEDNNTIFNSHYIVRMFE